MRRVDSTQSLVDVVDAGVCSEAVEGSHNGRWHLRHTWDGVGYVSAQKQKQAHGRVRICDCTAGLQRPKRQTVASVLE